MIDIAYESFVNDIAMELFGSQKKKTNEFNSLSDTELAKNVLLQTLDSYKKRKDNLIKKYHGLNGLFDIMDYKISKYVSSNFSIDINDIDGNYLSIKPFTQTVPFSAPNTAVLTKKRLSFPTNE